MNIALWVLQIALAWLCIAGGVFQIFKLQDLEKGVAAMRELPHGVWMSFGVVGCLTGLGLILPGMIHGLRAATPTVAAVVAAQSVLISALYIYYGDHAPLPYSIAMTMMAACIAYGRFALAPL